MLKMNLLQAIVLWCISTFALAQLKVEPCNTQKCQNYFVHFKKNAQRGHADSIATLAEFYYHGFGTSKNLLLAMKYHKKAARLGVVRSQYKAALLFLTNERFKDHKRGMNYLRKAAYNDHINAPYLLGIIYYSDEFGEKNKTEADKWLAQAYKENHDDIPEFIEHIYSFEDITQASFPSLYAAMEKNPMIKTQQNRFAWPPEDGTEVITVLSPDIDSLLKKQMLDSRKKIKQLGSRMAGIDCRTSVACRALTLDEMKDSMNITGGNVVTNDGGSQ